MSRWWAFSCDQTRPRTRHLSQRRASFVNSASDQCFAGDFLDETAPPSAICRKKQCRLHASSAFTSRSRASRWNS